VVVEVLCSPDWLADTVQARLAHLATAARVPRIVLRVTLTGIEASWIEACDSKGRCERGSLEYALYHARKWIAGAFVSAHPDLIWLHAAAASLDDRALLLVGPAGAGKSTLLVHLLRSKWLLLAEDLSALLPGSRQALPLPFCPEVRVPPPGPEEDWQDFLERSKTLATVEQDRVASKPAVVSAIVLPEYADGAARPRLEPLTAVEAAQALAPHAHPAPPGTGRTLGLLFGLVQQVPCHRLRYADPSVAAVELTARHRRIVTKSMTARIHAARSIR
jgi:hypothetical protein